MPSHGVLTLHCTMPVIHANELCKHYGKRTGIDRVSFDVEAGQIFGFIGPNGAGKTTTIRLLLGFLRPTSGTAHIFGSDCWSASHGIKREVGYLPGDLRLYPWMTCENALRLVSRIRGRDCRVAGHELAERFFLESDVRVRSMSRGMRQKLGLILALANDPGLVVLDEPTTGLDPLVRDSLADLLRERAAEGRTVFFSSHTLSEVEDLCDRVAIVRRGRIVANESLDSLKREARRTVAILFTDAQIASTIDAPEALAVYERSGAWWRCDLTGTAPALLQWAATQPIRDITIGEPDLESIFRSFYQDKGDVS